jgi:hypothetical protein
VAPLSAEVAALAQPLSSSALMAAIAASGAKALRRERGRSGGVEDMGVPFEV